MITVGGSRTVSDGNPLPSAACRMMDYPTGHNRDCLRVTRFPWRAKQLSHGMFYLYNILYVVLICAKKNFCLTGSNFLQQMWNFVLNLNGP